MKARIRERKKVKEGLRIRQIAYAQQMQLYSQPLWQRIIAALSIIFKWGNRT